MTSGRLDRASIPDVAQFGIATTGPCGWLREFLIVITPQTVSDGKKVADGCAHERTDRATSRTNDEMGWPGKLECLMKYNHCHQHDQEGKEQFVVPVQECKAPAPAY
jgi:hypothetical protein